MLSAKIPLCPGEVELTTWYPLPMIGVSPIQTLLKLLAMLKKKGERVEDEKYIVFVFLTD